MFLLEPHSDGFCNTYGVFASYVLDPYHRPSVAVFLLILFLLYFLLLWHAPATGGREVGQRAGTPRVRAPCDSRAGGDPPYGQALQPVRKGGRGTEDFLSSHCLVLMMVSVALVLMVVLVLLVLVLLC